MISAEFGFGDAIMVLKAKTTMKSIGWAPEILRDLSGFAVNETRSNISHLRGIRTSFKILYSYQARLCFSR